MKNAKEKTKERKKDACGSRSVRIVFKFLRVAKQKSDMNLFFFPRIRLRHVSAQSPRAFWLGRLAMYTDPRGIRLLLDDTAVSSCVLL